MTAFVGLDLAWTPHHPSGVCVMVSGPNGIRLQSLTSETRTPDEFAAKCAALGVDVVVAVDAPLVVESERRAEALLGKIYGAKHAGAYSANMTFLEKMNGVAGPTLARCLAGLGFELDPGRLREQATGRFALEVFPHTAHIELFQVPTALKYKK